jgi:hypothetical protein
MSVVVQIRHPAVARAILLPAGVQMMRSWRLGQVKGLRNDVLISAL